MPVTADQIEQGSVLLLKGGAYLLASRVVPHTTGERGSDLVVQGALLPRSRWSHLPEECARSNEFHWRAPRLNVTEFDFSEGEMDRVGAGGTITQGSWACLSDVQGIVSSPAEPEPCFRL